MDCIHEESSGCLETFPGVLSLFVRDVETLFFLLEFEHVKKIETVFLLK